jgi:hypothetical protein
MPMPRQLRVAKRRNPRSRGYHPSPLFEQLPSLDCRWLARKKLFPRDHSNRDYNFEFINPAIRWLTLSPYAAEIVLSAGHAQMVPVIWLRITGMCQSVRPIFHCRCGRRAFKLYYSRGAFTCRRCTHAVYACQQRSASGRIALQATRLRHFLGGWPGLTPSRPPFMHKRTYQRLTNRLRQFEARVPRKVSVTKLGDRLLRPSQMYRTQLLSIANT